MKQTPFAIGRRWFVDRAGDPGRARFWFVIVGPGENYDGKPSTVWKRCRIDVHPDDIAAKVRGYQSHGCESVYPHRHLKKCARLEPIE